MMIDQFKPGADLEFFAELDHEGLSTYHAIVKAHRVTSTGMVEGVVAARRFADRLRQLPIEAVEHLESAIWAEIENRMDIAQAKVLAASAAAR